MIDGDTTLYASWLKWWLRFGDDPKYKDNDKSIWSITLSNEDWSKKVTIMDKNIWAAFSWWGYYFPSDSSWKKYTKLTMLQVDVPRKREMKSEMKGTWQLISQTFNEV
jgi:hypothetical protein